jgi:hypothetical protein
VGGGDVLIAPNCPPKYVTRGWVEPVTLGGMCRSIQTLRPPFVEQVTEHDVHAAALQYVRKIAGMRAPSAANAAAFDEAVAAISAATTELLERLVVRPSTSKYAKPQANASAHSHPAGAHSHPAGAHSHSA